VLFEAQGCVPSLRKTLKCVLVLYVLMQWRGFRVQGVWCRGRGSGINNQRVQGLTIKGIKHFVCALAHAVARFWGPGLWIQDSESKAKEGGVTNPGLGS